MDSAHPPRRGLRLVVILATASLAVLSGAAISPALPSIGEHFKDVPHADFLVRMMLTTPALFIAACALPMGAAIDRLGRRPTLFFALTLFGIAGSAGLYLNSIAALLASRALLGVAVAGAMTCSTTLVADEFHGAERNRILGLQGAAMALGGLIFLTGGGWLADLHWRGPFGLYLLSFLILPAAMASVVEPGAHARRHQAATTAASSYLRKVFLLYAAAFLGMALFYMVPVHLSFHLRERFGATNTQSGLALGFSTIFMALVATNYRRMHAWLGFRGVCVWVYGGMGLSYVSLWLAGSYATVFGCMLLLGLSQGMFSPNLVMKIAEITPERVRGRALGGLTSAIFLGQFSTPILSQPFVVRSGVAGAFAATGIMLLIMAPAFLLAEKGRSRLAEERGGA